MRNWEYYNPCQIKFGTGSISSISEDIGPQKFALVTTPGSTKRGVTDRIRGLLEGSLVTVYDAVQPNPTFDSIRSAFVDLKPFEFDAIIALGGGSAIDTAKALAAMTASNDEKWLEEHLKGGLPLPEKFIAKPIIAIPTTAGTGSEVTMWGTIWEMDEKRKFSISHSSLYPKKAILDPELTLTLPEKETIYSGLDALSHAMESIWNINHNAVSDMFALEAISLVHDYLPKVTKNLADIELRAQLVRASLFAGLAFSNTKTALAHSISYLLTTNFGLPHGLACGLPLLPVMEYNSNHHFERIGMMAKALGTKQTLESMKEQLVRFFGDIGVSLNLGDYGISESCLKNIVEPAIMSERAGNNIVNTTKDDVLALIGMMF